VCAVFSLFLATPGLLKEKSTDDLKSMRYLLKLPFLFPMVHQDSFISTAASTSYLQIRNNGLEKQQSKKRAGEEQQEKSFGKSFHISSNHSCLSSLARDISLPCRLFL